MDLSKVYENKGGMKAKEDFSTTKNYGKEGQEDYSTYIAYNYVIQQM